MLVGRLFWSLSHTHGASIVHSCYAQGVEKMRASGRLAADVLAYAGTLVKVCQHCARLSPCLSNRHCIALPMRCLPLWCGLTAGRGDDR